MTAFVENDTVGASKSLSQQGKANKPNSSFDADIRVGFGFEGRRGLLASSDVNSQSSTFRNAATLQQNFQFLAARRLQERRKPDFDPKIDLDRASASDAVVDLPGVGTVKLGTNTRK